MSLFYVSVTVLYSIRKLVMGYIYYVFVQMFLGLTIILFLFYIDQIKMADAGENHGVKMPPESPSHVAELMSRGTSFVEDKSAELKAALLHFQGKVRQFSIFCSLLKY